MWQSIINIPTDGTLIDLCLYNEKENVFYRIINAFFDNGWKYNADEGVIFAVWEYDREIVAWMYPIAPPDIKLINIPIDTPVIATDSNGISFNAHFAGISESGNPLLWVGGRTSFTTATKYECESIEKFTDISQENK